MEQKKIKVRIPSLGDVVVEGDPRELENFIKAVIQQQEIKQTGKKKQTIKAHIINLIKEGFFDQARSLVEIRNELSNRGFKISSSTLFSVILRSFLREGHLQRIGSPKLYKYFLPKETIGKLRIDESFMTNLLDRSIHYLDLEKNNLATREDIETFATINDYFLFVALDALKDKNTAINLVNVFKTLGLYAEEKGSGFYTGMFFALEQLLILRFGILTSGMELQQSYVESITRSGWEDRLKKAKERLGIQD